MSSQEKFNRYMQFLETDPENINLLIDAAHCAYDIGQFNDVASLTHRGLSIAPDNNTLRVLQALATLAQGKPQEAAVLLQRLVDEGEHDSVIRYNLAYCRALNHEYAQALELLDDAEAELQNLPQMTHLKIKALHFLGNLDDAIASGEKALTIVPQDATIHGLLSSLYIDDMNFDLAKQHAEQAIASGKAIPEAHASLGTFALSEQDDISALQHFEHAIQIKPNSGRAWLGKGMTEMLQNRLEPAENTFNTALEHMPKHLGTWHALAWCQIAQHNLDDAEKTLNKAMEIDENFAETHGALAIIAVLRGNLDAAKLSIRRALGLDNQSFSGLFAQALLLKHQGRAESSQKLIDGMLDQAILPNQQTLRQSLMKHMSNTQKH